MSRFKLKVKVWSAVRSKTCLQREVSGQLDLGGQWPKWDNLWGKSQIRGRCPGTGACGERCPWGWAWGSIAAAQSEQTKGIGPGWEQPLDSSPEKAKASQETGNPRRSASIQPLGSLSEVH